MILGLSLVFGFPIITSFVAESFVSPCCTLAKSIVSNAPAIQSKSGLWKGGKAICNITHSVKIETKQLKIRWPCLKGPSFGRESDAFE